MATAAADMEAAVVDRKPINVTIDRRTQNLQFVAHTSSVNLNKQITINDSCMTIASHTGMETLAVQITNAVAVVGVRIQILTTRFPTEETLMTIRKPPLIDVRSC